MDRVRNLMIAALLVTTLLSGCAPDRADYENMIAQARTVGLRRGSYFGLAWTTDDWIVVGRDLSGRGESRSDVWLTRPDGRSGRQLQLPALGGCRRTEYEFPSALSDGRIALGRVCSAPAGTLPVATFAVVAATPTTDDNPVLLADLGSSFHPIASSWNSTATKGIGGATSGICASLRWLTPTGAREIPAEVGSGAQRSRIDDDGFRDDRDGYGSECAGGRATAPAWSPDDQAIAFFASPASVGLRGQRRLDAPWNLYVMDAETLRPRELVSGVKHARGTTWSPDGRLIAYIAEGKGVFVVSSHGGRPRRVSDIRALWLAWSPDSKQLAVIASDPDARTDDLDTQLLVLELREQSLKD